MRNIVIFSGSIIFLVLLCTSAFGQNNPDVDYSHIMEIPLIYEITHLPPLELDKSKELKDLPEIKKTFEQIQQIFEQIEEVDGMEYSDVNIDSLYIEVVRELVILIQEYPNSKYALTSKLRLALLPFVISHNSEVMDVGGKLLDEIIAEFPDTWQGKYALVAKAEYLCFLGQCRASIDMIKINFQEIVSLDDDKDSDFHWYKQKVDKGVGIDIYMRKVLIINYCRLEDYENAQKECEYIIQNYPNFYNIDSWKRFLDMIKQHESPFGVIRNGKVVYE